MFGEKEKLLCVCLGICDTENIETLSLGILAVAAFEATFVLTPHLSGATTTTTMKMIEKRDYITVLKGTHKIKTGTVTKMLRVFITIQFDDESTGRTLPSSVKIMSKPEIAMSDEELEKKPSEVLVTEKTDDALEKYRVMSVAVLTEMLAQGMALSGQQPEKQLARDMMTLHERIKEIRRCL